MEKHIELQKLIYELADAKRKYDRLVFDEEVPRELGAPCSPKEIAILEGILGAPLPPSYRAFLELHNGWDSFVGDSKLLSVDDHRSEWVKNKLASLDGLFYEFEDEGVENPFKEGAIPILLGKDDRYFLILDPRTVRPNGEMDMVSFDITTEESNFSDLTSFLLYNLELTLRLIDNETKGTADEDDDEA